MTYLWVVRSADGGHVCRYASNAGISSFSLGSARQLQVGRSLCLCSRGRTTRNCLKKGLLLQQALDLSHNHLRTFDFSAVLMLENLWTLDLSHNEIVGNLDWVRDIRFDMTVLNAAHNRMSGNMPWTHCRNKPANSLSLQYSVHNGGLDSSQGFHPRVPAVRSRAHQS